MQWFGSQQYGSDRSQRLSLNVPGFGSGGDIQPSQRVASNEVFISSSSGDEMREPSERVNVETRGTRQSAAPRIRRLSQGRFTANLVIERGESQGGSFEYATIPGKALGGELSERHLHQKPTCPVHAPWTSAPDAPPPAAASPPRPEPERHCWTTACRRRNGRRRTCLRQMTNRSAAA